MTKFTNPVRGHVPCPVCNTQSTVHQAGEGKLIATGEPPKSSRNLGLHYYRCPECGNSGLSKRINQYIETALNVEISVDDSELDTVEPLDFSVESVESVIEHEASNGEVERVETSVDSTEQSEEAAPQSIALNPIVKRCLIGLGALIIVIWLIRQLMPKKDGSEGGEDVATA